ncbi:MAG: bifunctional ADP-dependent (S)-NAD(P)H-hydrate dehydratase/NAD(P)H-hydrate epimerase [Variovorax sp.]|nr:bifunctional ADP-dependent (S)-NAD(P)H-hydrate dehydratase/NAD(P)H-hydrate epimerase [Variovorax sp.]
MQRITSETVCDLFDIAATRRIEVACAAAFPAHTLMQRAGLATARLAMAIAPHARTVWIACGPGNNGGDGFEAAFELQRRGFAPVVTFCGDEARLPPDAMASLRRAREAGVAIADEPPARHDLAIDALLGIGSTRAPEGTMAAWLQRMRSDAAPLLSIDVPSGLNADTGTLAANASPGDKDATHCGARYCLSLLTLKPGLFTAQGRDAVGEVWFDDLGCATVTEPSVARLAGKPISAPRAHASHKGSYGDVAVIGGAPGMVGAALLAASAALHAGAGRVLVGVLDPHAASVDAQQPELMLREAESLDLSALTVVCGCGGGTAVRALLPRVISVAKSLVLDADALNAIAVDVGLQQLLEARVRRGRPTVLTPHPLEAARLLGVSAAEVQSDRLGAARMLAARFGVVVLKGSGSVVAGDGAASIVNLTGNARLATAGTGDVLAGMVGAALAAGRPPLDAAREAVWHHGALADRWPENQPLTAGALARRRPG